MASSGIVSLLLPGEHTSHSMFRFPIEMYDGKTFAIMWNNLLIDLLREVDLMF